jgi:hypothetical protein
MILRRAEGGVEHAVVCCARLKNTPGLGRVPYVHRKADMLKSLIIVRGLCKPNKSPRWNVTKCIPALTATTNVWVSLYDGEVRRGTETESDGYKTGSTCGVCSGQASLCQGYCNIALLPCLVQRTALE